MVVGGSGCWWVVLSGSGWQSVPELVMGDVG